MADRLPSSAPDAAPGPTYEDVAANQGGAPSARQEEMLRSLVGHDDVLCDLDRDDPARRPDLEEEARALLSFPVLVGALVISGVVFSRLGAATPAWMVLLVVALLALLARANRQWIRAVLLRQARALVAAVAADRAEGRVASGIARVTFERDRYVIRCGGRLLRRPWEHAWRLPLVPGEHRAFFLPRSGLVLALAPVDGRPGEALAYRRAVTEAARVRVDHAALGVSLRAAHRLDQRWIRDNRRGALAPRQVAGVLLRDLVIGLLVPLSLLVLPAIVMVLGSTLLTVMIWIITGPFILAWAFSGLRGVWRSARELWRGKVRVAEGLIQVQGEPRFRAPPSWYYVIDGEKLAVSPEARAALVEGVRYRVWFTPETRRIVGIEPADLSEEEPDPPAPPPRRATL